MKKIVWRNGLIAGVIISTFMAISMIYCCKKNPESMGGTGSMIAGFLAMFVAFAFVFVAIKTYRDRYNNGTVSLGKAIGIGLLVTLIASTMYVATWAVVYHFVIPDFMDIYSAHQLKQAEVVNNPAEFQAKAAEMQKYKEMYKNPLLFALITYTEILPVGLLVTIVSALILRRRKVQAAPTA
jgi:hypothetical protein